MSLVFRFLVPLVLLTVVRAESDPQDHWRVLPKPTTQNLNKTFFLDSLKGWVVGNKGTIRKTTNGGASWQFQNAGIINNLHEVFMLNDQFGWALGLEFFSDTASWYGTYILKTTNGGTSWQPQQYPTNDLFYSLVYLDSLTGWMGGEYGVLVGTTNGGATWFPAETDSSIYSRWAIRRLKFFSRQYGIGVGGRIDLTGVVWQTTNGGQRWTAVGAGLEPLHGIHFVDSTRVITVGGDYDYGSGLVETTDGGSTWDYRYLGIWGEARALSFRTAYEGWAPLGFAGTYMFTTDTGRTWTDSFTPDTSALYDLMFTDSLTGYAVGQSGTILKYDLSVVGVRESAPFVPTSTILMQNYPNPFNPLTIINYQLSMDNDVTLKIYDLLGREVATLLEQNVQAGLHQAQWDGTDVAGNPVGSGLYFYRLEARPSDGGPPMMVVRKMVLLR